MLKRSTAGVKRFFKLTLVPEAITTVPRSPDYTEQPWTETYSEIVDVRSPSEFAEDHMPGAVNLPVLDNAERAEVGTLYKQCPFTARKVGAALVAQNISRHLAEHLASKDKDYHPLVYCSRGGQRSNSMATVLVQIGWQVTILQGGYKTYRTHVRAQLQQVPEKFTYQVLCGLTGTGKTAILQQLAYRGIQVLDLEGLANHRGSLLGERWHPQPSQKYFESLLLKKLQSFVSCKPVWVEAESNKIGCIYLPKSLWQEIIQASCIEVQMPLASRTQLLLQEYSHLTAHPNVLKAKLQQLKSRYGREKLNKWNHLIDTNQWEALVRDLLQHHYDPAYTQALQRCYFKKDQVFSFSSLSDVNINTLLDTAIH